MSAARTAASIFAEGMSARLSCGDPLASNVGLIVGLDHTRESDGMRFWAVDFHPESDRMEPVVVAESALVLTCSWFEEYADEWGLACSEPGVPTSITIPCGHDATRLVCCEIPDDDLGPGGPSADAYCDAHAVCAGLDLSEAGLAFDVEEITR